MEKKISFDEWLKNYVPPELIYFAEYDPESGAVIGIYPGHSAERIENKILIDNETAELIINGNIKMMNCVVDLSSGSFEIAETKNLIKIDDVLHRIVNVKYTEVENPEIFVSYDRNKKSLIFELASYLAGTKQLEIFKDKKTRKIHWSGDTVMNFYITEYNDPNVLKKTFSIIVSDLVGQAKIFDDISLPEKFSVYTRRLFKGYVLEEL
jgi:hypothetical protein